MWAVVLSAYQHSLLLQVQVLRWASELLGAMIWLSQHLRMSSQVASPAFTDLPSSSHPYQVTPLCHCLRGTP